MGMVYWVQIKTGFGIVELFLVIDGYSDRVGGVAVTEGRVSSPVYTPQGRQGQEGLVTVTSLARKGRGPCTKADRVKRIGASGWVVVTEGRVSPQSTHLKADRVKKGW